MKELTSRQRLSLALLWLALLLVVGWVVGQRLQVSGDLRKFMPRLDQTTSAAKFQAAAAAHAIQMRAV